MLPFSFDPRPLAAAVFIVLGAACSVPQQRTSPSANDRTVINPPGITPLVPAYSVAVRTGEVVYVSGMTAACENFSRSVFWKSGDA